MAVTQILIRQAADLSIPMTSILALASIGPPWLPCALCDGAVALAATPSPIQSLVTITLAFYLGHAFN